MTFFFPFRPAFLPGAYAGVSAPPGVMIPARTRDARNSSPLIFPMASTSGANLLFARRFFPGSPVPPVGPDVPDGEDVIGVPDADL